MGILSIFVDESGDFGGYSPHSPYYIVTMVFHDQTKDISAQIQKLDSEHLEAERWCFRDKRQKEKNHDL